jgi:NAD(P)-dependent dehydrogenase (short-subunit alcohol dehydrogenase family)
MTATETANTFDPRDYAPSPTDLSERILLITGAGSGIGRAVALACAAAGGTVVLSGRNVKRLEAVHAEIETAGRGSAIIAPLDLERAVARDYDTLADAVIARYGRLDGLLHNAAILGTLSAIADYDVPLFTRVMHVNVTAAFALTQVLIPALKNSSDASVVFTSSGVGRRGRAYWGAYAVSKFAVEGLAQVLAHELEGSTKVRVNVINPGKTRTAMRRAAFPSEDLNTLPTSESITAPYLALLGPASRGVTGRSFDAQRA